MLKNSMNEQSPQVKVSRSKKKQTNKQKRKRKKNIELAGEIATASLH